MRERLVESARNLARALEEHALIVADQPHEPPAVIPAVNRLREVAREHVQLIFESAGWGNPFQGLMEEEVEQEDESVAPVPSGLIEVNAQYILRLIDTNRALELVRERMLSSPGGVCEEDISDHPADIVNALFSLDGWDPWKYRSSGIEVVSATSQSVPVDAD